MKNNVDQAEERLARAKKINARKDRDTSVISGSMPAMALLTHKDSKDSIQSGVSNAKKAIRANKEKKEKKVKSKVSKSIFKEKSSSHKTRDQNSS